MENLTCCMVDFGSAVPAPVSVSPRDWVGGLEGQFVAQGDHMANPACFQVTEHPGEARLANRSRWVVIVEDHLVPLGEDKESWVHWAEARHLVDVAVLVSTMDCLEAGVDSLAKPGVDRVNRNGLRANLCQVVMDLE
jgi:hypothetical protein